MIKAPPRELDEAALTVAREIAAKDTRVMGAAKEALNGIDPVDVNESYRFEQGFTYELNLAGVPTSDATSSSTPLHEPLTRGPRPHLRKDPFHDHAVTPAHPAHRARPVEHPIVQTGMGWVAGPRLVSATAKAGTWASSPPPP